MGSGLFVLLQAPILMVLKRYGDMLQIVLGSLQVALGLALLQCIVFLVQLKHCSFSVTTCCMFQHNIAQLGTSKLVSVHHRGILLARTPKLEAV